MARTVQDLRVDILPELTQTTGGDVAILGRGNKTYKIDYNKFIGNAPIQPTGNDQASEIEEYINDTNGDRNYAADFGYGTFIIGSPIRIASRKTAVEDDASGVAPGRCSMSRRRHWVSPPRSSTTA